MSTKGFLMLDGKLRAWTERQTDYEGVKACFLGVSPDQTVVQREPATRSFTSVSEASVSEARQWVEEEAQAIGVAVDWVGVMVA